MSVAKIDQWQNTAGVAYNNVVQSKFYFHNDPVYATGTRTIWFDLSITPKYSNSSILILANFAFGRSNLNGGLSIKRNGDWFMPEIGAGFSNANTSPGSGGYFNTADDGAVDNQDFGIYSIPVRWLDTTGGSATITYTLDYWMSTSPGGGWVAFNRQYNDNGGRAVSTCTLLEISN